MICWMRTAMAALQSKTGKEALEIVKTQLPDLVLDGYTAA